MKKIGVFLVIIFLVVTLLCISNKNDDVRSNKIIKEKRGVFVSYIEIGRYLKGKDVDSSKKEIDKIISNINNMGFNMIILQIRSFADAIYYSDIFPWSYLASGQEGVDPGYDILEYFIECAHKNNIQLYGWINPYRVRSNTDISSISNKSPAYKYIDTDTLYVNNGIYFNPSKSEVEKLVVDGVREVVSKYDIDGILFDDYFYPDSDIDIEDYNNYIENNSISLNDYHLMIINNMIKKVHEVCKKYNKKFGVSPDGNIDNNYSKIFADVREWGKSDEYVDFLMPQVYYGFFNEARSFVEAVNEWRKLVSSDKVELYFALAFYKVGSIDVWAKNGREEWLNSNNIIMREVIILRNIKKYKGFALFRYDHMFNSEYFTDKTMDEIKNLEKILDI